MCARLRRAHMARRLCIGGFGSLRWDDARDMAVSALKVMDASGLSHQLAASIFFPSPEGRGSKVRDLIQRAIWFARDSKRF
jgi:hypothetical protein